MLFDPILNLAISDEDEIVLVNYLGKPLRCSHCYRPIKGALYQSGENFYDEHCWHFKYVIDPLFIQRGSRKSMKDLEED